MKLRAHHPAALDHGGERLPVRAGRDAVVGHRRGEAVHEIGPVAGLYTGQQRAGAAQIEAVPTHVRNANARRRRHPSNPAGQHAQTLDSALVGGLEQQLHAQADAQQRLLQAAQQPNQAEAVQLLHRRTSGADAGQDHPIGHRNALGLGGHLG